MSGSLLLVAKMHKIVIIGKKKKKRQFSRDVLNANKEGGAGERQRLNQVVQGGWVSKVSQSVVYGTSTHFCIPQGSNEGNILRIAPLTRDSSGGRGRSGAARPDTAVVLKTLRITTLVMQQKPCSKQKINMQQRPNHIEHNPAPRGVGYTHRTRPAKPNIKTQPSKAARSRSRSYSSSRAPRGW